MKEKDLRMIAKVLQNPQTNYNADRGSNGS